MREAQLQILALLQAFAATALVDGFTLQTPAGRLRTTRAIATPARKHNPFSLNAYIPEEDLKLGSPAIAREDRERKDLRHPDGAKNAWEVHKFGGASLATAELYRTVGDLLIQESGGREDMGPIPTMAVVSARGGMTDLLVRVVDSALEDLDQAEDALQEALDSQITLLKELAPPHITDPIEARFRKDAKDILSVVQSLQMLHTVPAVTMEVATGFGEIWSAQTLHAYLQTKGVATAWMDARDVLAVKSEGGNAGLGEKGSASTGGVRPMYEETTERLSRWWNTVGRDGGLHEVNYSAGEAPFVIVTGFVARTMDGVPTTLKRSGSDYSATIFAKLTGATRVTMWKNTDGVYTADPRKVPDAFSIEQLHFDEAMEFAYFGAQVLHPSAMEPCIEEDIPVYVRNIFNPSFKGTVIQGRGVTLKDCLSSSDDGTTDDEEEESPVQRFCKVPIKGITSVDKTALITLEGASIGGAHVAERFMGSMAANNVNVLMITQANSESSITVAVPENEAERALAALEDTFELELSRSTINSLSMAKGMAIVAIVGEGIELTPGVASTFMGALGRANVNIRLIAQGSSERQIAVVVENRDVSRSLRAVHSAFTLSETTASVAVLDSTGDVGSSLVRQMHGQTDKLAKDLGIHASVKLATNREKMVVSTDSRNGIKLDQLEELLEGEDATDFDLERVTQILNDDVNPLRVVIDCTSSEEVADYYDKWLSAGINVISEGTTVAAGSLERYNRVCEAVRQSGANWQYEAVVGSALPISTTLRDLFETGDEVKELSGCVSGAMAYVLSSISEEVSFSEAVRQAADKLITHDDLRDDLSGQNMASKVVLLARQLGLDVSLEDVEVESLIPDEIVHKFYPGDQEAVTKAILKDIARIVDEPMLERFRDAKARGNRLRYRFTINTETGKCQCSLLAVDSNHPLYRLKLDENLVAFETSRYVTSPLIMKGAASGPDLAAGALFADLLRLTRAHHSSLK